jgi:hypothetical protein
MTTLPEYVFLTWGDHKGDPLRHLAFIKITTMEDDTISLTPISDTRMFTVRSDYASFIPSWNKRYKVDFRLVIPDPATGVTCVRRTVTEYGVRVACDGGASTFPILQLTSYMDIIGARLRRNVKIAEGLMTYSSAPLSIPVVIHDQSMTTVVSPQPPPPPKIVKPVFKQTITSILSPYIAKQLFELARIKKEMCPITAEEYIVGETAVMPCGHLFMNSAIEESFKQEPGCCPACRQRGKPIVV